MEEAKNTRWITAAICKDCGAVYPNSALTVCPECGDMVSSMGFSVQVDLDKNPPKTYSPYVTITPLSVRVIADCLVNKAVIKACKRRFKGQGVNFK